MIKYSFIILLFGMLIWSQTSCIDRIDGPIAIDFSIYPKIELNLKYNQLTYTQKVYYDLESQKVIDTALSADWDIAIASDMNSARRMIMNYANGNTANGYTNGSTNFADQTTESQYLAARKRYANHYDPAANLMEGAVANQLATGIVYYINNGSSVLYKVQLTNIQPLSATIRYARIDGSGEQTRTIALNPQNNYTYFSFATSSVVKVEPADKMSWDIEMTKYTAIVTDFDSTTYYGVTGALFNPAKSLAAAVIPNKSLEAINLSDTNNFALSKNLAAIGYDWKKFSNPSQDGFYSIVPRSYIIRGQNRYYGWQFIEFSKIENGGLKRGYPTFLQRGF